MKYIRKIFFIFIALCLSGIFYSSNDWHKLATNNSNSNHQIFIVKQRWHTGFVIKINEIDTLIWPSINQFTQFSYIDVGWGDEDFYQHPDFDAALAVKALFYPTNSTLRMEAFNLDLYKYIALSDMAAKIELTQNKFNNLCRFIYNTYDRNDEGDVIILNQRYAGRIKFYKAKGKYYLFNTCNTWIAKGLRESGFNELPDNLIFAEQLFKEVKKIGKIIDKNNNIKTKNLNLLKTILNQ